MGSIRDEEALCGIAPISALTWARLIYGLPSSNVFTADQLDTSLAERASKDVLARTIISSWPRLLLHVPKTRLMLQLKSRRSRWNLLNSIT